MQSFRERSGFHGNQPCYQQEPHELSRLENYRHHHGQARQGYEAHSLAAVPAAAARAGPKDCYGQPPYTGYGGGGSSTTAKKPFKGGKISGQALPSGFGNRLGSTYSAQYVSEGHLQQKWEDPAHLPQYKQDMVGRLEAATGPASGGPQYLEQNVQPIPQSQCSHATQPSTPVYTSHHQQNLPQNTSPSTMSYAQGHMHYPQHSQSLPSTASSYMEKCSSVPHCYKGYGMPSSSQYTRPVGSNNGLKQTTYRSQNSYSYQQPPSRPGYDQQAPLQGLPNAQDGLSKYQHFSQQQQNYCLSDMAVRSPEHYYQNCSPSSSQSPARSVGRSPSYSSTPSPLMVNSETFQYNQPPVHTGTPTSTALQEQGLLMPPHSHTSSGTNHPTASYTGAMKDRFSEKLLSNPSLWSLNALTSQVENISNNVQQLLLSEALIANKKGSKRNAAKKAEDYKGQLRSLEEVPCSDMQHGNPAPEAFSTPQSVPTEMHEGGYSNSSEGQLERNYYCCSQNRSPGQASTNPQLTQDIISSCSLTSPNDMSAGPEDCGPKLQTAQARDNLDSLPWLQSAQVGEPINTSLTNMGDNSSQAVVIPSPQEAELNSPINRQGQRDLLKENFEESAWTEEQTEEMEAVTETGGTDYTKTEVCKSSEQMQELQKTDQDWTEDDKHHSVFHNLPENKYSTNREHKPHQAMHSQNSLGEEGNPEKSEGLSDLSCKGNIERAEKLPKLEMYRSELPSDPDTPEKTFPFFWRDDLMQDQYLTMKDNSSELPQFNSRSELLEERLLTVKRDSREALEEQSSVLSHQPAEVRKDENFPQSEEDINNTIWSRESGEFCRVAEERGEDKLPSNTETAVQDMTLVRAEQRLVACNIAPPAHSAKTAFLATAEKAAPPTQTREHIDRRDAEVLEPDSPQLPGKSILHSAPSWADTPPSPKKGDEDIEPGISCPSAVTPSTKSEPLAPSANIRVLNRKHGRGRRSQVVRHIQAGIRIRRHPRMEADGLTSAPQKSILPPSECSLFPDQLTSSQTPRHFPENFPSRMCTRSITALAAPKMCLQSKKQSGPKTPEGGTTVDTPSLHKDLVTKIKWMRQKGVEHTAVDQTACMGRYLTGTSQQEDKLEAHLHSCTLTKDQKPMVLRSRKPTHDTSLKEKGKEKKTICSLPKKLKDSKKQREASPNSEVHLSPKQNQALVHQRAYRSTTGKSGESPSKRKSSFHPTVPLKKHKGMLLAPEMKEAPSQDALTGAKGSKKKLKRAEHFIVTLDNLITSNTPPASSTCEIQCPPPQCPTKTKYLPPRKGRGLKYEAMVQKITSPGSKKHVLNLQTENTPIDLVSKTVQQDVEPKDVAKSAEVTPEDASLYPAVVTSNADGVRSTMGKQKAVTSEGAEETGTAVTAAADNLVINTPRLAKQRAIKNNHEMHLKQRRKRRKGVSPLEGFASEEQPEPQLGVLAADYAGEPAGSMQPITAACRRGKRKPSPAELSQAKALGRDGGKKQNSVKKARPKRRNRKTSKAAKATDMGQSTKTRHMEQNSQVVKGNQPEMSLKYILCNTQKNESRAFFSPYVHIDSSKNFVSLCTIVNRPEEELLLQTRKKNSAKIKNSVTVAKAMPNSSVMLQGPLVNKSLTDRCLTCCLCGKPANFRELGDLCGPYYSEDSIPRKMLSYRHKPESREGREETSDSLVPSSPLKKEAMSVMSVWDDQGRQPRWVKRVEGSPGVSCTARPSFREQYRKLQRLQNSERRAGESDSTLALLRRLQLEAEVKEHWAHEACIVWTSGVVLIAGKLYGLTEAAQAAAQTSCSHCQSVGASVSCSSKGCVHKFHFICAKETGCLLKEDNFSMKCMKHKSA